MFAKIRQQQSGVITMEFMTVFPTFLIICLFVFELGFWHVDRHILKLATFDAARALLNQDFKVSSAAQSCEEALHFQLPPSEVSDATAHVMASVHRQLALKMAYTAPSSLSFLQALGIQVDTQAITQNFVGEANLSASPILRSLLHMLWRFPAAYALTRIESCSYDPYQQALTLKTRYLRRAKMPIVEQMIWLVFVMQKAQQALADAGLQGLLKFDLNDLYLGAELSSPALQQLNANIISMRSKIKDTLQLLNSSPLNIADAAASLAGIPFISEFSNQATSYAAQWQQYGLQIDQELATLSQHVTAAEQSIRQQSSLVSAMILAVPASLRLVPMYESVTLNLAREANTEKWNGTALAVAPFTLFDDGVWQQWTKGMQQNQDALQ